MNVVMLLFLASSSGVTTLLIPARLGALFERHSAESACGGKVNPLVHIPTVRRPQKRLLCRRHIAEFP